MAEDEQNYNVGPGRPPLHTRFKKGRSGNPGGKRKQNMPALLADTLDEPIFITIDGERRQLTKRRRSSINWSTNRPPPTCARPKCCST